MMGWSIVILVVSLVLVLLALWYVTGAYRELEKTVRKQRQYMNQRYEYLADHLDAIQARLNMMDEGRRYSGKKQGPKHAGNSRET